MRQLANDDLETALQYYANATSQQDRLAFGQVMATKECTCGCSFNIIDFGHAVLGVCPQCARKKPSASDDAPAEALSLVV